MPGKRVVSPSQKCRKNNWKVGDTLKSKEIDTLGYVSSNEYWEITAIGIYEVLGLRIKHKKYLKMNETMLPLSDEDLIWRKVKMTSLTLSERR